MFKPGDKIRALNTSYRKHYIAGNIYTVKKYQNNNWIFTELDESGSTTNGWGDHHFVLVPTRHYKWRIIHRDGTIEKTEHHVAEDKIDDYCEKYLNIKYYVIGRFDDDFVEE